MVLAHAVALGAWIGINTGVVPGIRPFDPFPFNLLMTVVSIEVIFLTLFVLLNQNRMTREADKRDHLSLQIDLLAEREMTLILRILYELSAQTGARDQFTAELQELLKDTDVRQIAEKLDKELPNR